MIIVDKVCKKCGDTRRFMNDEEYATVEGTANSGDICWDCYDLDPKTGLALAGEFDLYTIDYAVYQRIHDYYNPIIEDKLIQNRVLYKKE